MAKVKGPLFSIQAYGELAQTLVFQRRRGAATVYGYTEPKVPNTAGQVSQQTSFASAISSWRVLPAASKVWWLEAARGTKHSGYNLYVQNYLLGTL